MAQRFNIVTLPWAVVSGREQVAIRDERFNACTAGVHGIEHARSPAASPVTASGPSRRASFRPSGSGGTSTLWWARRAVSAPLPLPAPIVPSTSDLRMWFTSSATGTEAVA
jgi:hypothetical protein